ncbi:hypothetical protein TNCV_3848691 [Trichonephila clavipes]|uniref:Uncharacterized protein n=1 Tax=Trichonephila clavipes TaxID=2585209 RepID=A0A8X6RDQ9_TRICX|nr:hypothetical protein TNCV_3848691 [Trichonephila clavipes]
MSGVIKKLSGSQKRKIRKEKEYNINSKYAKLDNFLISASSSSCAFASSSNVRELDEQSQAHPGIHKRRICRFHNQKSIQSGRRIGSHTLDPNEESNKNMDKYQSNTFQYSCREEIFPSCPRICQIADNGHRMGERNVRCDPTPGRIHPLMLKSDYNLDAFPTLKDFLHSNEVISEQDMILITQLLNLKQNFREYFLLPERTGLEIHLQQMCVNKMVLHQ